MYTKNAGSESFFTGFSCSLSSLENRKSSAAAGKKLSEAEIYKVCVNKIARKRVCILKARRNNTVIIVSVGILLVALILVGGTLWMGSSASKGTDQAARNVSLLYLDELAGRRKQVVENSLQGKIDDIRIAVDLMTKEDLSDSDHLRAYQAKMKRLFNLEKFAFVDTRGTVYTALEGRQDGIIGQYQFDYQTISEPEISVLNPDSSEKKAVIAIPIDPLPFEDETLTVCFMEIDMAEMLSGVSMETRTDGTTFCNIYTSDGVALTNVVLGGLAEEDNLLEALKSRAEFEDGSSYEQVKQDFTEGTRRVVSFSYNGIRETLSYVPITGTSWMLTYLIRESLISDQIRTISGGTLRGSLLLSGVTVLVLVGVFAFILSQLRKNARLQLEKETTDAENRIRQEDLEQRLALQEKLLTQQKQGEEQSRMIAALSSDYWSVYYVVLDTDEGVCYQSHEDLEDGFKPGERFRYLESFTAYANRYVKKEYREEFLAFIQPDQIRFALQERRLIAYRYLVHRHGHDAWEEVRLAGVRHPEDREDHLVHAVGACFVNVDAETRKAMEQNLALQDALAAAEQASKAKTIFLSNMSHEIRTPMNAIIGLDNIAMNDPEISDKTRGYLEKIDSSAGHLLALINDILDMSRIESGQLVLKNEEFSFPRVLEAINTIFSSQCQHKSLDYQCHINGEVDDTYIGDNMKLRQVLINILSNAVKFTPEGGSVSLTVERTAQFDGHSTLRFRIADTGIGMSKEFLPHLFDTFTQEDASTTNRYGSSGLGMAITKNIVEMMNGTIEVESEKGKGTVFTVTVTLLDAHRQGLDNADIEIRPEEINVLIVDDDPIACEHAKLVLEKAGIASEIASCGKDAVEMVRLRHARMEPYNLILVDWQMPEMDGVETARQIRAIMGHESVIIILTAYRWDDALNEAMQAGVDSFIAKPLFAAQLLEEFQAALKRKNIALMPKEAEKADLAGRRVLLAEDVEVNAEIMTMVLQMRDVEADLAVNGRIAVEKFAEHEPGYYSAILMDMRMPEMDGLEATRRIRAMDRPDAKTIPMIALTANAFDEDVQRSLQAGLNAHLSKPVQPDILFETLENLIH